MSDTDIISDSSLIIGIDATQTIECSPPPSPSGYGTDEEKKDNSTHPTSDPPSIEPTQSVVRPIKRAPKSRTVRKPPPSSDSVGDESKLALDETVTTPSKKRKQSKAAKTVESVGSPSGGSEEIAKNNGKNRSGIKRREQTIQQFLDNVLPALRKEMSKRKKETFDLSEYAYAFQPNSKIRPTFLLPLFHFLNKNEIAASRYGEFESRHMIKTMDGFNHCLFLSKNTDEITEEDMNYLMKRFGKEWFKIPAKDSHRMQGAIRMSQGGQVKISLVGVYEDSFFDPTNGEEVFVLNPILNYEPIRTSSSSSSNTMDVVFPSENTKKRKNEEK